MHKRRCDRPLAAPRLTANLCARRQQRVSALLALEEAGVGHVGSWPRWVQALALKEKTLTRPERFAVTLLWLGNGVLPRAMAAYLAAPGLLADQSARAHRVGARRACRDARFRVLGRSSRTARDAALRSVGQLWLS